MSLELPPLRSAMWLSCKRELRIGARNTAATLTPALFFISVSIFIPLGINPDAAVLSTIAPGIIWVIALLAMLLSLDKVFQSDFEDGCLEQMVLSGQPLYWLVLVKILVHWLLTGIPLTLLSPILAAMMSLDNKAYLALMTSLFLGSGALGFIGAIGSALTVGLRRGGLLVSLITIPLYVPILIFGSSAVYSASKGDPYSAQAALLGVLFIVSAMFAPFAAAGALRVHLSTS